MKITKEAKLTISIVVLIAILLYICFGYVIASQVCIKTKIVPIRYQNAGFGLREVQTTEALADTHKEICVSQYQPKTLLKAWENWDYALNKFVEDANNE